MSLTKLTTNSGDPLPLLDSFSTFVRFVQTRPSGDGVRAPLLVLTQLQAHLRHMPHYRDRDRSIVIMS